MNQPSDLLSHAGDFLRTTPEPGWDAIAARVIAAVRAAPRSGGWPLLANVPERAGQGRVYISELHPFRQYLGTKATFERDGVAQQIRAFIHHISDFLKAAESSGLRLVKLSERWHEADDGKLPRVVIVEFENSA